jgi:opacity protein-like surface antigen
MKLIKLISAVFICLISLSAFADQNSDARKAEALLKDGKNEGAYQIYMSLFRADPDNRTIAYGLARSALLAGHPNQAVAAYEHLITKEPNNKTFLNGLSRAYTALKDKETAGIYASRSAPKRNASPSSRYEVHGGLRAGSIYDSNANLGPASNYLRLGNYSVTLNDVKQIPSYGMYIGGNIDASYRVAPKSLWRIAWDAGMYARYNFNDKLEDIDREYAEWYRLALGMKGVFLTRMIDFRVKSELYDNDYRIKTEIYNNSFYQTDSYKTIFTYGAELTFLQAVRYRYHFITSLSWDKRDYDNENYTGTYAYAGEYLRIYFDEILHSVTVGGRYSSGEANNENLSYDGWDALVSARLNITSGLTFTPQISYGKESYKGAATVLETKKRKDTRWTAGLTLQYPITESIQVQGAYQYTNNSSNSGIYDYTRHTVSLEIDWKF